MITFLLIFVLRHQLELLKKGDLDVEIELVLKNTAQDFADASAEELAHFKPADRITGVYVMFSTNTWGLFSCSFVL